MEIQTQEARIILAIEAIRTTKKLSCRKAAKLYKVPETSLRDRITSRPQPNYMKLTKLKEKVII